MRATAPDGGLLAVHAHPDDETLSTGALLATWAASGAPVTLVTCTRGERGEVLALPGTTSEGFAHLEGDGPALAAYRESELAAALAYLGVHDSLFLDEVPGAGNGHGNGSGAGERRRFEDSGMAWVAPGVAGPAPDAPEGAFARMPSDDAAARLAAVIRDRRPSVVVTYEPGGGYGHPDHVRAHEVTVRALDLAADPEAPVEGNPWPVPQRWEAVVVASELRAARRQLAATPAAVRAAHEAGLSLPDPDEALPPVAKPADLLGEVASVDVAPVLGQVMGALHAHATQVQHATRAEPTAGGAVLGWYALSNGVLAPVTARETYAVRGGPGAPVGSSR